MIKIKNVLVTGRLGGISLNICKYFIKKNHNLIIVDNLSNKISPKKLSSYLDNNNIILSR